MCLKTREDCEEFHGATLGIHIHLYGSCARGDFGKMSDIDICIVNPDNDWIWGISVKGWATGTM